MFGIKWEPYELDLIEEVREQIEAPKDNIALVLEKLLNLKTKPEIYHIKRILVGLTLLDTRQYFFYEVTINARSTLGIKDSQSSWSIKIHISNNSLKGDLKEIFNLDELTVDEVIGRAK